MAHLRRSLLAELKIVCDKRRALYEETPASTPHSFLAVIRTRVESLAFLAELKKHEDKARTLFADVFSPVPRELHGFTKPAGFATGFSGVRVGVQNSVPQRNPYPCHGYVGWPWVDGG